MLLLKRMKEISLENIFLARKTAMEMLSQRGFNIDPSIKCISKDRLSIIYGYFKDSIKERSSIMDIQIKNTDSQAYIAWCPEKNAEREIPKIVKFVTDTGQLTNEDDLVIIIVSNSVPNELLFHFESDVISVFSLANLQINISKHYLVPQHKVLDADYSKRLLKQLMITGDQLPQINRFISDKEATKGDPIARFYGMRVGDIVEITRNTKTSGTHRFFREVVGFYPSNSQSFTRKSQATGETTGDITEGLSEIVHAEDKPSTRRSTKKVVPPTMENTTITLTFGEAGENHAGMEIKGETAKEGSGFTPEDLQKLKTAYEAKKYQVEYHDLTLDSNDPSTEAAILIIRDFLNQDDKDTDQQQLFEELQSFKWDTKYLETSYGRSVVFNKHARSNVLILDGQSRLAPIYEDGEGTWIDGNSLETYSKVKQEIVKSINDVVDGDKASNLICEGNQYFDLKKCGIGWHGDKERRKVIALRVGAPMPMYWAWFKGKYYLQDKVYQYTINGGDLYIMSEKAVGTDFKKRNIFHLRHSAGCEKMTNLQKKTIYQPISGKVDKKDRQWEIEENEGDRGSEDVDENDRKRPTGIFFDSDDTSDSDSDSNSDSNSDEEDPLENGSRS